MHGESRIAIAAAGGIPVLVSMAQSEVEGALGAQEFAGAALWILAMNDENRVAIANADYDVDNISVLVFLAFRYVKEIQVAAAERLGELAALDEGNRIAIAAADGLDVLAHMAKRGSEAAKATAVVALKNLALNSDNKREIASLGAPHGVNFFELISRISLQ